MRRSFNTFLYCRQFAGIMLVALTCSMVMNTFADDNPYHELGRFDFDGTSSAPAMIEKEIRDGGQAVYKQVEEKLLEILAKPDITYACKKVICTDLAMIGSKASINPLLSLLADEKTSDMARLALESIPGKSVDSALVKQLRKATGKTQIGIIQSLAARHNSKLANILEGYMGSGNADLVKSSLRALGRVGGDEALKVLKTVKVAEEYRDLKDVALMEAAYNVAADGGRRKALPVFDMEFTTGAHLPAVIAAFNGSLQYGTDPVSIIGKGLKDPREELAMAAAQSSVEIKEKGVDEILCNAFHSATPAVQVAIIRALAERGARTGVPVLKKALASADKRVQGEAVSACEKIGDSTVFNDLFAMAVSGDAAAQQALSKMNAADINGVLAGLLDNDDPSKVRAAIMVLRSRDYQAVLPKFLILAESDKTDIRVSAVQALEGFAGENEIPVLVKLLEKNKNAQEQDKIAMVLWRAARSIENEDSRFTRLWNDAAKGPESTRCLILPLASAASGAESLKVVTGIMASGSDLMKEKAARTLFKWQSDNAVKTLAEMVKGTNDTKHRILAMQAVVRILTDKRCSLAKGDKLAILNEILSRMERQEDKQAVENAVKRINDGILKK